MDITFHTSEGRFNYRVCAIFLHQNKVLAMRDERSPYYYLPGGRVALGRDSPRRPPAGAPGGAGYLRPHPASPVAEPGLFHRRCRR